MGYGSFGEVRQHRANLDGRAVLVVGRDLLVLQRVRALSAAVVVVVVSAAAVGAANALDYGS